MDAITKYDIQGLYKVFNFEHYEAPLSRIARLTGTKQEEVEELLGVCQLVQDEFDEVAYREYLMAYDIYIEQEKQYRAGGMKDLIDIGFIKGDNNGNTNN